MVGSRSGSEDTIRLSKRYWGSPFLPLYWRLAGSLAWFRFDRTGRAHRHYQRAGELARHGRGLAMLPHKLAAVLLAPDIAFYTSVFPRAQQVLGEALRLLLQHMPMRREDYPQTAVYMDRTDLWADGWAGPRLIVERESVGGEQKLLIRGRVHCSQMGAPLTLSVTLDGVPLDQLSLSEDGAFSRSIELPAPAAPGRHTIEIQASTWMVHHRRFRNGDYRPVVWRLDSPDGIMFSKSG